MMATLVGMLNGLVIASIQVPPFINEGDRIRVDPIEGRYIERAK